VADTTVRIATIGVYGFDETSFIERLQRADVRAVLDVRQRRGVRGPEYAWANSRRLQAALTRAGIEYAHRRELAPTTELRQLQYAEDARNRVGKRARQLLADEYTKRYTAEILDRVDLSPLVASLRHRPETAALLCVECEPAACHRSLIALRMSERFGMRIEHLRPR
jgi:uncharacterized protein (DUF488 family)